MRSEKVILEHVESVLDNIVIRDFIKKSIGDSYSETQIYIIYDGHKIELYDKPLLDLRGKFNQYKSYYISNPLRFDINEIGQENENS